MSRFKELIEKHGKKVGLAVGVLVGAGVYLATGSDAILNLAGVL